MLSIRSLVSGLLSECCPPAIRFFIVAVDVDAVDGLAFGTRPHVSEEVLKR